MDGPCGLLPRTSEHPAGPGTPSCPRGIRWIARTAHRWPLWWMSRAVAKSPDPVGGRHPACVRCARGRLCMAKRSPHRRQRDGLCIAAIGQVSMGLLVQEMVVPACSFIVHTHNPTNEYACPRPVAAAGVRHSRRSCAGRCMLHVLQCEARLRAARLSQLPAVGAAAVTQRQRVVGPIRSQCLAAVAAVPMRSIARWPSVWAKSWRPLHTQVGQSSARALSCPPRDLS